MANPASFVYFDPSAAPDTRRVSTDPHVLERSTSAIVYYISTSLPDLPVSAAASLSALDPTTGTDDEDGVDRISALPDSLLGEIVTRLPIKDAARTAALSRRRSSSTTPTSAPAPSRAVLPRVPTRRSSPPLSRASSSRTRAPSASCTSSAATWTRTRSCSSSGFGCSSSRASKSSFSSTAPWPLDLNLPVTLLNITTLTRLFIGVWKFPDTLGLPRGPGFPNLRELILCCVSMKNRDMDFVLARSPVLETLGLQGIQQEVRLRLVGRRLQCVQICLCVVESITVVDAPRLERLILWGSLDGSCIKLRIDHAPKLCVLGYIELAMHKLESGDAVTNARKRSSSSNTSPSVKILSLSVRFGVRSDVKMVPTFLRCFPNVETLHIKS